MCQSLGLNAFQGVEEQLPSSAPFALKAGSHYICSPALLPNILDPPWAWWKDSRLVEPLTSELGIRQTQWRRHKERAGINSKWLTLIMFDVLPTDKQKQERRGARRWVAQRLGAGRATDTFAVQKHDCPLSKNKYITTTTSRELHISAFEKMFLPWMWMWDKASLLPVTVWPSPFVFLLLLLNVEACKDTKNLMCCIHLSTLISQTDSCDVLAVFTLFQITASGPSPLSATEVFLPETLEPKAVFWTLWGLPFRLLVFAREKSSETAKESQFWNDGVV